MKKIIFVLFFLFIIQAIDLFSNGDVKFIATFDNSLENHFKGLYNRVVCDPSYVNVYQDYTVYYGKNGRSLKIFAHREKEGWCGVWMHLYKTMDELQKQKIHFYNPVKHDYKYLSFMVKGKKGGEKFKIGVADKKRLKAEDPLHIGNITDFLKKGVKTRWQEVIIPLEVMDIDISTFGLILFDFVEPGDYTIYIDNICFKKRSDIKPKFINKKYKKKKLKKNLKNAMWCWLAPKYLFKKDEQDELFKFCNKRDIHELFFQILYKFEGCKKKNNFTGTLINKKEHAEFIRNAHKHNIKVHALDGYPDWVMRERHHEPMALCKAICDYNKEVKPEERFDGVHLDNEPYLMIAFKSPFRPRIYKEYIELNEKLQKIIDDNSEMVFGIDIPFFLEQPFEKTGVIEIIEYKGKKKPTSFHLLDIVDNVGIMAYRDFAYGADGVIYHAKDEINYAEKIGKPIYIGLETFKYPLIDVYFTAGYTGKEFNKRLKKEARDFAFISRINGFRIQTFDDGKNIHVGIEIPQNYKNKKKIRDTLRELGRRFSINEYKKKTKKVDQSLEDADFGISSDVEWMNMEEKEWKYNDTKEFYRGFKAIMIMLPKITFAEESLDYFKNELKWIQYEFSNKKSFYGFAIHYYDVFKKMK